MTDLQIKQANDVINKANDYVKETLKECVTEDGNKPLLQLCKYDIRWIDERYGLIVWGSANGLFFTHNGPDLADMSYEKWQIATTIATNWKEIRELCESYSFRWRTRREHEKNCIENFKV